MDASTSPVTAVHDGSGTWQLAGPAIGTYPSILNRTNADYVASGRVSALAIAPTCVPGNCRLWVGGGGRWHLAHGDALASTSRRGRTCPSSLRDERDRRASPTTPRHTRSTQARANRTQSADSDAGVGIYKSTNGGDTLDAAPREPGDVGR